MKAEDIKYAQMGRAAMIPGFQYAIEVLQAQLDDLRSILSESLNGAKSSNEKPSKQPRDRSHPEHEAWVKKMSVVRRKFWKSLTPEQRAAHMAKMQAGRRKQAKAKRAA